MAGLIELFLLLYVCGRIVGDLVQMPAMRADLLQQLFGVELKMLLALMLLFVALRGFARDRLVVAFQCHNTLSWNAIFKARQVKNTHQRIASADVVVQETERLALGMAFDPQRHATQVHRQRILVNAINAMRNHVPFRRPYPLLWVRLIFPAAHTRQMFADPPRRRQQEMPRAACRVTDANTEQSVF